MLFQAHRGVSTEYPENTMAAFRAAAAQKYDIIETDPSVTADGEIVLFHDKTLARTCRLPNGEPLPEDRPVRETTFAELRGLDAGLFKGETFRGERVPLFTELLAFSAETGIPLKIDNKVARFSEAEQDTIFALVRESGAPVGFTCANFSYLARVLAAVPDAPIHYDGEVSEPILRQLRDLCGNRPLTVWLPMKSRLTSWVKVAFADEPLCRLVKQYAALGLWILDSDDELAEAQRLGADVIETTGSVKPRK